MQKRGHIERKGCIRQNKGIGGFLNFRGSVRAWDSAIHICGPKGRGFAPMELTPAAFGEYRGCLAHCLQGSIAIYRNRGGRNEIIY